MPLALRDEALSWAAKVGHRLPEPAARRLRPLYARMLNSSASPGPSIVIPPRRPLGPEPEFVPLPPSAPDPLQVWPKAAPAGYLGQLDPDFQEGLVREWETVTLADCLFYHRVQLKDGRVIEGSWNLIGGEEEYLGGVDIAGRRVLELGPASGWLTTWMELNGASVVGFDLGWEQTSDLIPLPGLDLERLRPDFVVRTCRAQNSWWYLHRDYDLSAKAVYGSVYELPEDMGRFDLSIFAAILLHLRDPFRALERAAGMTDDTMIVVEPLVTDLVPVPGAVRWNPTGGVNPTGWWNHSPGAIVDMLRVLGFGKATVTYHQQPYSDEDYAGRQVDVPFFTVAARR